MLPDIQKILSFDIAKIERTFSDRPKLIEMFRKNFTLFFDKYASYLPDGSFFALPCGNIPATWLRDSSLLMEHLLPYAAKDEKLAAAMRALIAANAKYICIDPYANSFKPEPNESAGWHDVFPASPWVWERKYELDSLTFPFRFAYKYYCNTGDDSVFDSQFKQSLVNTVELFEIEQHHTKMSQYRFQRENCPPEDTLIRDGRGAEVGETGMIWTAFNAGDAASKYGYLIPSNLLAAVVLGYMCEISEKIWKDTALEQRMQKMKSEIESGIMKFGIVEHPKYGKIFAYDTDGLNHYQLLDDALLPNLISLPYFECVDIEDEIYKNTRNFVLSVDNPNYYVGKAAKGLASVHIPGENIWPLSLAMQGLTATDMDEVGKIIDMLASTDNGTGMMHETFNVNDPSVYTWDEFCLPSSIFCVLLLRYANKITECDC